MIQVKVVESILSSLTWSIMNPTENLKSVDSFISMNKRSESSVLNVQEKDALESNVDTNEDIDMEDLFWESNLILTSSQENDVVCKKSSMQDLNSYGMRESNLLGNFHFESIRNQSKSTFKSRNICRRKEQNPLKVSSEENSFERNLSCKSRSTNVVSLIIDRLKKDFQRPDNFVPRIRAHTNWKPSFVTNCFNEIKQMDEEPRRLFQKRIFSCGPEKPRIYSIGFKYKSTTDEYERKNRRSLSSEIFKNKSWLKSFDKNQKFQIYSLLKPFPLHKSCFPTNFDTIKCGCIQCLRSREKATGFLKSSKSITEQKFHSLPPFHQIAGIIKNDQKVRKRNSHRRKIQAHEIVNVDNCAREKEKIKKESWKNLANKLVDKKYTSFRTRKETTSSDEEDRKTSRRKNREKSTKNLDTILPIESADRESIIFCEDTLSEKLNQDFRRQNFLKTNQISVEDSPKFCKTELRKIDKLKANEDTKDSSNTRDNIESQILKNIKTRIDDDIDKSFYVRKLVKNSPPDNKYSTVKPFDFKRFDNLKDNTVRKEENLLEPSKSFHLNKVPIKSAMSFIPQEKKSLKPIRNRSLQIVVPSKINQEINLDNSDFDNSSTEWRNLNLTETSRSSKRNLIESVDSGVLTDFSLNDHRTSETSFRSTNDSLREEKNQISSNSEKKFPLFDSDSESSWSDDEALSRKLEEVVKRFTEELILCERRIKARIKSKNMLQEEADERTSIFRRRRKSLKPRSKSSFVISPDFSKTPLLSSEEDFVLNISTPSLSSLTDSEYEKSS